MCDHQQSKPICRRILTEMGGIDVEGTPQFFEQNDGLCDCQVASRVRDCDEIPKLEDIVGGGPGWWDQIVETLADVKLDQRAAGIMSDLLGDFGPGPGARKLFKLFVAPEGQGAAAGHTA